MPTAHPSPNSNHRWPIVAREPGHSLCSATLGLAAHVAVFCAVLLVSGCGTGYGESPRADAGAAADGAACSPLRLVLFQDLSGSGATNRTPRLTAYHLEPVLGYLASCGGEIAIGAIGSASNKPLLRLRIPKAPDEPPGPSLRGTAFHRDKVRKQHAVEMKLYQDSLSAHSREAQALIAAFLPDAELLLTAPATARRTDVWGAIARAALFLGEPDEPGAPSRKAAILVTDALDNAGHESGTLPEDAVLYLVNGEPTFGELAALNPIQFEAIEAAINHLLRESAR